MKTFSKKFVYTAKNQSIKMLRMGGNVISIIIVMICATKTYGQLSKAVITINDTEFTGPLVERWISEYSKLNPSQSFKLTHDPESSADLNVVVNSNEADDKTSVRVGRYAILPIINEKNLSFSKEFKKGIRSNELKRIFLKNDSVSDRKKKDVVSYTVYTQTPQSGLANTLSNFLGRPAEELNGLCEFYVR
jgi:ABC-type phosphate transport system substrate-binding protein